MDSSLSLAGKVKWFGSEKGYGFIVGADGVERYFSVRDVQGADLPKNGDAVEFRHVDHQRGPRASSVVIRPSADALVVQRTPILTLDPRPGLKIVSGRVSRRRPVTRSTVQVEFEDSNLVVELSAWGWAIDRGDTVAFAGEMDHASGKFIGYAYRNDSKGVRGQTATSTEGGVAFVISSFLLAWAIFPLFTHLPAGLRIISFANKVRRAAKLLT